MYVEYGNKVEIPKKIKELKGMTSKEQARRIMSGLFGIGDVYQESKAKGQKKTKVSVRQLVPYLFLSKGIIDSETTLLHGLNDQHAAKHIMGAMPFFLGVIDEKELAIEKQIKQLQKAIESEERKRNKYEKEKNDILAKCQRLIEEAIQVGIFDKKNVFPDDLNSLLLILNELADWKGNEIIYPDESRVKALNCKKEKELEERKRLRRKRNSAKNMESAANDFSGVVKKQIDKVKVNQFFNPDAPLKNCPICSRHLKKSSEQSEAIDAAFTMLTKERKVVQKHRPVLSRYIEEINEKILKKGNIIKQYDQQIKSLVRR
ncbi:MAG: hypothetical protein D3923_04090 [Candidatus Electrothrix sp. AR3]|nr:hypothetical protein [Candidatus Electrothrix sp. AR3]